MLEHQEEEGKLTLEAPNKEGRAKKAMWQLRSGERGSHHLQNSPNNQIPMEGRKCISIWEFKRTRPTGSV